MCINKLFTLLEKDHYKFITQLFRKYLILSFKFVNDKNLNDIYHYGTGTVLESMYILFSFFNLRYILDYKMLRTGSINMKKSDGIKFVIKSVRQWLRVADFEI